MEFNEKLQELRKQRGLTQEELAEVLYVSRTAVSKWESGRGYPNIDSLKVLAQFFDVTVDKLLSGEELLTIAEEETEQKTTLLRDLVFGLLDCSVATVFFLPLFRQMAGTVIQEVSLVSLDTVAPYLKAVYIAVVMLISLWGVLTLALQNCACPPWVRYKHKLSLLLSAVCTILFVIGLQPYAATFLFVFFAIKVFVLFKHR